jgi:hypothetical protein
MYLRSSHTRLSMNLCLELYACIFQVNYYVQSHIQINEYRDRFILVSDQLKLHVQLDNFYEFS